LKYGRGQKQASNLWPSLENPGALRRHVATLTSMSSATLIKVPVPAGLSQFKLPAGVQRRLTKLLDQQDSGSPLTSAERREAEGLVELAEFLSLLKLRTGNAKRSAA
jgi:hypothetical protein